MLLRLLTAFLLLAPLRAQEDDGQKNTALLKIYPKLEELVGEADRLARDGKYAAALEIYAEACDGHPNNVVPLDETRAVGVWQFVLDRVASWPKEGQDAWRRRHDPAAAEEFERAKRTRDQALLDDIVERYPLSSVVGAALLLRADLALDAGDPDAAARALELALAREEASLRPLIAARLGLAYSVAGRRGDLLALLKRAQKEWPNEDVLVSDAAVPLPGLLQKFLDSAKTRRTIQALEIPGWEMIGGGPTGARLAEDNVKLGGSQWRIAVPLPTFESNDDDRFRRYDSRDPTDAYRPLYPAVADGIVYVHNEYSVVAANLFSAGANVLWTHRVAQPAGALMFDDRVIHATTVHDGRVYANLITALGQGEDQLGYVRVKFPFPKRALFALDAYTGRLLWRLGGQAKTDTLEENATFSTPPTPDGDRLYVGAVRQKLSTDPFEHYLLCVDAATGRVLWSTFVASGLTEINLFGNSTRESLGTPVAVSGDTVYYGTNHGIFAAVEKKTGRLRWSYRYAQLSVLPTRSIYIQKNPLQWVNSVPIVSGGVAVYAPTDSRYCYGFDAATGKRLWRLERDGEMRVLIGAKDKTLVIGGEELYFVDLANGRLLESVRMRSPGVGRGAISENVVYLPTKDGVSYVRLDTRKEIDFRRWASMRAGSNLVVVDGTMVRAGCDAVEAFYDKKTVEQEVEDAIRTFPGRPLVGYRCAVRLAQSGRAAEAVELFEKVFAVVDGSPRPDEERLARACRLRLFHLRLALGKDALRRRATAEARDHLARSVELAPETGTRLEAALLLADTYEAIQAPERAIRSLYALLDEADPRVAETVRARVDEILRRHGQACFAGLERDAADELEKARREGTPEALLAIVRRWPNSASAESALRDAAQAYGRLGRPDEEIQTLREFLREFPASREAADVHVRIVLALEKRGQFAAALPILRRLVRDFGGSQRQFAEKRLASERYRLASGTGERRTALEFPLRLAVEHRDRNFIEVAPVRIGGAWPASAADRVYANYGTAFGAVGAWTVRLEHPLRFAHFVEDSIVLGTDLKIVRVNAASGAVEWTFGHRTPMRGFALLGNQVCFLTSDTRSGTSAIAAVDAGRGALSWSRPFEGYAGSSIQACGELAVFLATSPSRLYGFEAETGRNAFSTALAGGGLGVQILHAAEDFAILGSTDRFLEYYEFPAGKLKWRATLQGLTTRILEVNATSILLVATRNSDYTEKTVVALVDLRNGKYSKYVEGIELGEPRYAVVEEDRAVIVSREGDRRETVVRELRLKDFTIGWTANLGEAGATLLPPAAARDHVAVVTFDRGENAKFGYSATLLDKSGKTVQNIRTGFEFERPPNFQLANGSLVLTVESAVRVYRK